MSSEPAGHDSKHDFCIHVRAKLGKISQFAFLPIGRCWLLPGAAIVACSVWDPDHRTPPVPGVPGGGNGHDPPLRRCWSSGRHLGTLARVGHRLQSAGRDVNRKEDNDWVGRRSASGGGRSEPCLRPPGVGLGQQIASTGGLWCGATRNRRRQCPPAIRWQDALQ